MSKLPESSIASETYPLVAAIRQIHSGPSDIVSATMGSEGVPSNSLGGKIRNRPGTRVGVVSVASYLWSGNSFTSSLLSESTVT